MEADSEAARLRLAPPGRARKRCPAAAALIAGAAWSPVCRAGIEAPEIRGAYVDQCMKDRGFPN
jgi:hypothetical protein